VFEDAVMGAEEESGCADASDLNGRANTNPV
jgi:hypothetical protein